MTSDRHRIPYWRVWDIVKDAAMAFRGSSLEETSGCLVLLKSRLSSEQRSLNMRMSDSAEFVSVLKMRLLLEGSDIESDGIVISDICSPGCMFRELLIEYLI